MSGYRSFYGGDNLSRSCMWLSKPAAYAVNGSGRDSYIAINNGGMTICNEPSYNPDVGSFGNIRK